MHAPVPVRFGRGRLDSLGNKGLAAYLIHKVHLGNGRTAIWFYEGVLVTAYQTGVRRGEVALDNLGRASALLGEPRKATG